MKNNRGDLREGYLRGLTDWRGGAAVAGSRPTMAVFPVLHHNTPTTARTCVMWNVLWTASAAECVVPGRRCPQRRSCPLAFITIRPEDRPTNIVIIDSSTNVLIKCISIYLHLLPVFPCSDTNPTLYIT